MPKRRDNRLLSGEGLVGNQLLVSPPSPRPHPNPFLLKKSSPDIPGRQPIEKEAFYTAYYTISYKVARSTQGKNVVFHGMVYLPNSMHESGSIMPIMGGSISPIIDISNGSQ